MVSQHFCKISWLAKNMGTFCLYGLSDVLEAPFVLLWPTQTWKRRPLAFEYVQNIPGAFWTYKTPWESRENSLKSWISIKLAILSRMLGAFLFWEWIDAPRAPLPTHMIILARLHSVFQIRRYLWSHRRPKSRHTVVLFIQNLMKFHKKRKIMVESHWPQ